MSDETVMMLRLLLACGLGMAVGVEREIAGKPAGFRTHALVCLGAALFALVSIYAFETGADRARVAAQVVTGVGFLGAGAIFLQKEGVVAGLTTAATIWTVAAIGLASATGLYWIAIVTTLLTLILLQSDRIFRR
jgi:putative Mg2+ transporter-C (MgtC) family protein